MALRTLRSLRLDADRDAVEGLIRSDQDSLRSLRSLRLDVDRYAVDIVAPYPARAEVPRRRAEDAARRGAARPDGGVHRPVCRSELRHAGGDAVPQPVAAGRVEGNRDPRRRTRYRRAGDPRRSRPVAARAKAP